jgi:NAD(P)-dependent dehydrogenase (short-subunit alcohol dehydrogenase family)
MLDSNGSNTTAVAAVVKLQQAASDVRGRRAVVTAATGPVGMRAAGLLALAGAEVVGTSRRIEQATQAAERIQQRFGAAIRPLAMADASQAAAVLEGTEILLNAAGAGVRMVPREAWAGRAGLRAAADVNAVPPLGIEGIELNDDGVARDNVVTFGALGVGNLKMKIHKACIARLFERNDLVLDAETIADVARKLTLPLG